MKGATPPRDFWLKQSALKDGVAKESLLLKNVLHNQLKKKKVDKILGSYPHLAGEGQKGQFGGFLLLSMVICGGFKPSTRLNLWV